MASQRLWLLVALSLVAAWALAAPVGSGFTYQGELKVSGIPASSAHDFEFALFNVDSNGSAISTLTRNDLMVNAGLFTVELDYTDVPFVAAEQYWLEIRVRDGGSVGSYTPLLPRQKITPAPYAVNARSVQAGGVNQSAIAAGAVGNSQIAASAVGSAQLQASAVDTAKINDLAVTNAKIANATITQSKLAFTPGDITAVTTSTGLTGGALTGNVALGVDFAAVQSRVTGTCPTGEYFRGIAANGTVVCDSVLAYLGITLLTTIDDPINNVGDYTDIAIGNDGLPVIAYRDSTLMDLKVAKCTNAACTGSATITTVDNSANNVGEYASIAIGSDGVPVISYYDRSAGTLKVSKCANPACTGTATITTVDDPFLNNVGSYTSIAIGSDGLPVIAYYDSSAFALKVAKCVAANCTGTATITSVDSPGTNSVGKFASLAIGSDGMPIISYWDDYLGRLKVAKCGNAACTAPHTITPVDDPAGANVGSHSSIAIGGDGFPIIAYVNASISALKVAKCVDAACSGAATITTINDVGAYVSIAIGSDGLPVISHYDNDLGNLVLARCATANCTGNATIVTIDDSANLVGQFTSIAIGTDGLPIISYHDFTARTLLVAKCGTRSCQ